MGLALLGAGDLKQAEVTLKQALELDPSFITNRYRLGHIYRLEQRYKDSAEIFAGILETDPGECMARYNQGIISEMMGKKQAARASFQASRTCMERQLRGILKQPFGTLTWRWLHSDSERSPRLRMRSARP